MTKIVDEIIEAIEKETNYKKIQLYLLRLNKYVLSVQQAIRLWKLTEVKGFCSTEFQTDDMQLEKTMSLREMINKRVEKVLLFEIASCKTKEELDKVRETINGLNDEDFTSGLLNDKLNEKTAFFIQNYRQSVPIKNDTKKLLEYLFHDESQFDIEQMKTMLCQAATDRVKKLTSNSLNTNLQETQETQETIIASEIRDAIGKNGVQFPISNPNQFTERLASLDSNFQIALATVVDNLLSRCKFDEAKQTVESFYYRWQKN